MSFRRAGLPHYSQRCSLGAKTGLIMVATLLVAGCETSQQRSARLREEASNWAGWGNLFFYAAIAAVVWCIGALLAAISTRSEAAEKKKELEKTLQELSEKKVALEAEAEVAAADRRYWERSLPFFESLAEDVSKGLPRR